MQTAKLKIFLCYHPDDRAYADRLSYYMLASGQSPWHDMSHYPRSQWFDELMRQIKLCDVFVYLLTPSSVNDTWCEWQLIQAARQEKPVVPLMLKKTEIPAYFESYQVMESTDGISTQSVVSLSGMLRRKGVVIPTDYLPKIPREPQGKPGQAVRIEKREGHEPSDEGSGLMIWIIAGIFVFLLLMALVLLVIYL